MIARFAQAMRPEVRDLPDAVTRYLSDLLGRRRQIVEMIASDKQREHRTTDARLKKSITRLRQALEKELERIDTDIDGQIGRFPMWRVREEWPRSQAMTGGKPRLLGITKRSNTYLRTLLIHGARLSTSPTPMGEWLRGLRARAHKNKVVVALARIAWAVLQSDEGYTG